MRVLIRSLWLACFDFFVFFGFRSLFTFAIAEGFVEHRLLFRRLCG